MASKALILAANPKAEFVEIDGETYYKGKRYLSHLSYVNTHSDIQNLNEGLEDGARDWNSTIPSWFYVLTPEEFKARQEKQNQN